jgi:two-component system sensor histidine kinase BarA
VKNLGIKYQILLITLIPVLMIDTFFTWSHITRSIDQANELLHSKGLIIARQIAGASEFNLFSGNDSQIQYLLEQSVDSDDIVLASVYDEQGNLIAESASTSFKQSDTADYVYFRQAILSQGILYSDVFAPDTDDARHSNVLGWVNLYISRQQLRQKTLQIISESIVFFILILIMAVILTIVIGRRITRPIFRLMEHLKLVETGQLGKIIEPTESNEIGAVQKGFNRMTHALLANRRHLNRRIQQATQQLNEAITDLESKNRELGYARDLAQDANRTKSEFLANMSHEIRTPINGIKGFISLLGQSRLDSAQRRYVDIILKSTSDLTSIVNEILDFSKMESGKLHIVDEVFDLYEVIEQTRDILFINLLAKSIDLNLIIFSDTPRWVTGDKLRLKQILLNLIGNAIKFTDQGRVVVRVCLEDSDDEVVRIGITVEDSGIGISAADQQSLFQAFSQVESSDTRRFSGTGLGLVISKNLATLMGGDISMQSTLGKGSKFSLVLPFGLNGENDLAQQSLASPVTALIFASEQNCLMEIRTLFERAGVDTESELIDASRGNEPVVRSIQRAIDYVDILVIDLRHLELELAALLDRDTTRKARVIVMHYDPDVEIPDKLDDVEIFSIINASRKIEQIVSRKVPADGKTDTVAEPAAEQSKKVLLVDDNQINLRLASELIQLWGHRVSEADNGEKAFEIYPAGNIRPDYSRYSDARHRRRQPVADDARVQPGRHNTHGRVNRQRIEPGSRSIARAGIRLFSRQADRRGQVSRPARRQATTPLGFRRIRYRSRPAVLRRLRRLLDAVRRQPFTAQTDPGNPAPRYPRPTPPTRRRLRRTGFRQAWRACPQVTGCDLLCQPAATQTPCGGLAAAVGG